MVFKFALKYIFKATTEEEKLKSSVIYGWSLLAILVVSALLMESPIVNGSFSTFLGYLFLIALVLYIVRYNSVKPLLGAASAGITILTISTILDSLVSKRDGSGGGYSFGALIGILFVIGFLLLKNLVLSTFYLIRETYRYYKYKKMAMPLEETI